MNFESRPGESHAGSEQLADPGVHSAAASARHPGSAAFAPVLVCHPNPNRMVSPAAHDAVSADELPDAATTLLLLCRTAEEERRPVMVSEWNWHSV